MDLRFRSWRPRRTQTENRQKVLLCASRSKSRKAVRSRLLLDERCILSVIWWAYSPDTFSGGCRVITSLTGNTGGFFATEIFVPGVHEDEDGCTARADTQIKTNYLGRVKHFFPPVQVLHKDTTCWRIMHELMPNNCRM